VSRTRHLLRLLALHLDLSASMQKNNRILNYLI
jgi:hypothetical protein